MMRPSFLHFSRLSLLVLALVLVGLKAPAIETETNRIIGVNYSPFRDGYSLLTNAYPTIEQMQEDMPLLKHMADYIRTYTVSHGQEQISALAQEFGLQVVPSAWLDANPAANNAEVAALISMANSSSNIVFVCVGSETLQRGELTKVQLLDYIHQVHVTVDLPVTTAEPWTVWLTQPDLVGVVDLIFVDISPYDEGQPITNAVTYVLQRYNEIQARYPDKPVVIGKTGWPSSGSAVGAAIPSLENQKRFIQELLTTAHELNISFFLSEAFDEPTVSDTQVQWGFYTAGGAPKYDFTRLELPGASSNPTTLTPLSVPTSFPDAPLALPALVATATSSPIACGQIVTNALSQPGQTNTYTFAVAAGQEVALTAAQWGGGYYYVMQVDLYDPSATKVTTIAAGSGTRLTLASGGTYTLLVHDDNFTDTGNYALCLQLLPSQCGTEIVCGQSVTNALSQPSESDAYTFAGTAGQVVALSLAQWSGGYYYGAWVSVYDPSGERIAYLAAGSATNLTLAASGTHTLLVYDDNFTDTGSYALCLQLLPGQCGTEIVCGQTVTNALSQPGQTDAYTFTVAAGQEVALSAAQWGGGYYYVMQVDLYDPSATKVTTIAAGSGTRLTLASGGTYTLLVHDDNFTDTGNYALCLQLLPSQCGTEIVCGQSVTNALSQPSESDAYTFTGTAGQVVALSAAQWGGGYYYGAWVSVYDPSGARIAYFAAGSATNLTLGASGTHTLLVYDDNFTDTGSYGLSLQLLPGQCTSEIVCDQTVTNAMSRPGQTDAYPFAGTAGQVVILSTAQWGGGYYYAMRFDLYDPSATKVATIAAGGATRLTLASSGTYTLLVHDDNFTDTGNYALGMQSPVGGGCGSLAAFGQTVTNALKFNGEIDSYSFSGTVGQVLIASLAGGSFWFSPQADIYDPSGQLVGWIGPGATNMTLATDGSYTILVHAQNYMQTGNYEMTLQTPQGGGGATTTIAYGQTIQQHISLGSEIDAYGFNGAAGELVVVSLAGGWAWYTPQADIYDPAGQHLGLMGVGATNLLLTVTGTYTVLVHAGNYADTLDYSLTLLRPTRLSLGETITATVSSNGGDYYAVSDDTPTPYFLLDSKGQHKLKLYVGKGRLPSTSRVDMALNSGTLFSGSSGLAAPASDGQPYLLLVTGATEPAEYKLAITNNLPALLDNVTIQTTVTTPGEDQYYQVTLPASGESIVSLKTDLGNNVRLIAAPSQFPDLDTPQETGISLTTEQSVLDLTGQAGDTWYLVLDNNSATTGSVTVVANNQSADLTTNSPRHLSFPETGFIVCRFTKSDSGPLYLSADAADGSDLQVFVSADTVPGPSNSKVTSVAGLGANRTCILNHFDAGQYWVTVLPTSSTTTACDIRLGTHSPAEERILAGGASVIHLDKVNGSSYLFQTANGNIVSVTYTGPGQVDILLKNSQSVQSRAATKGPQDEVAGIDTIMLTGDTGQGRLTITSSGPLTIPSLISEDSSLKSLNLRVPQLNSDIFFQNSIGKVTSTGNLMGNQFIAAAKTLQVNGDLQSSLGFGTLPQQITIGGDLTGSLTGIGNTKAMIGGGLSGRLDVIGDLSLRSDNLSGTLAAYNSKSLTFGSVTDTGLAVIYNQLGNLSVKGSTFQGGLLVGNDIGSVSMPKANLDGWISAAGTITSLKLQGIDTGIISAQTLDNVTLGKAGSGGLLQINGSIGNIKSLGPLNGTILSQGGIGLLQAPTIDNLNLFVGQGVSQWKLGRGPLLNNGILVTGQPLNAPANLAFGTAPTLLSDLDLNGARNLVGDYMQQLNLPPADPVATQVGQNLDQLVSDLTPVWGASWNTAAFQNSSLSWVDTSSLGGYTPKQAVFDIITDPVSELFSSALDQAGEEQLNAALGVGYSLWKGSSDVADFISDPGSLENYIGAITGLGELAGGITDIAAALEAGSLFTLPEVAMGATILGMPTADVLLNTLVQGQRTLIANQFNMSNYLLSEWTYSLQTGDDSKLWNGFNQYNSYMDTLAKSFNPDILANYTMANGGVNWDTYYNDTFGNYTCDYGNSYGYGSNLGAFGSMGDIGSYSFGSINTWSSSSYGSFGSFGGLGASSYGSLSRFRRTPTPRAKQLVQPKR